MAILLRISNYSRLGKRNLSSFVYYCYTILYLFYQKIQFSGYLNRTSVPIRLYRLNANFSENLLLIFGVNIKIHNSRKYVNKDRCMRRLVSFEAFFQNIQLNCDISYCLHSRTSCCNYEHIINFKNDIYGQQNILLQ